MRPEVFPAFGVTLTKRDEAASLSIVITGLVPVIPLK